MADDAPEGHPGDGAGEPGPQRAPQGSPMVAATIQFLRSRAVVLLGMLALSAVIVVNLVVIFAGPRSSDASATGGAPASPEARRLSATIEAVVASVPIPASAAGEDDGDPANSGLEGEDHGDADEPRRAERSGRGTVKQAVTESCSTTSVAGLSRQIIRQARCIAPNAFVPVPRRANLVTGPNVFLYMEASARDRLVSVLAAHPDRTMKVNSALRTVAQQYLLHRWASTKRCGIQLATPPGESNHETGLALDIADVAAWRPALEANEFQWLGAIDKVHFDYKGAGAVAHNVDVEAFQQLWNHAHPEDTIEESGRYEAATQKRLEKSPARGFPGAVRCAATPPPAGTSSSSRSPPG